MVDVTPVVFALLTGIATGMVIFLAAAGLTIVFGVLDVLNFAHGSFYMIGAYVTYLVASGEGSWSIFGGSFWVALLVASVVVAVVGLVIERYIIRPIYEVDHVFQLLLTFALVLVLDNLIRIIYGTDNRSVSTPEALGFAVDFLGRGYPAYNLFLIVLGLVMAILIWLAFERTRIGKTVRAAADDRDTANVLGINVPLVFTAVFLFGSAIAGFAGGLAAPRQAVSPGMGESIIIEAFIVVVIGGLGSFAGAFFGALLIGVVGSLTFLVSPRIEPIIPFLLLAIVLLVRPAGLFGEVEE
jgi:branched-subunit amino acid ABC-type transport system permease component